jgi:hypothetical protein
MIHSKKVFLAALLATTLLSAGGVLGASSQTSEQTMKETSADKDFGKLSHEGSRAFQDLTLTRLAIFDGRIEEAKKFITEAEKDLDKAKNDNTVFTKAEADLKSAHSQTYQATETGRSASSTEAMTKPIAWLPVNGAITINEDYTIDTAKTAAVADANKSLKSGDRKAALEKLKLAGMDVDITLAVIPVEQTIKAVHQATALINDGKYYEGSQVLRQIQESERFEVADIDVPKAPIAAGSKQGDEKAPATNP